MSMWSVRSLAYKICLIWLYVLFVAYVLGFAMPLWLGSNGGYFGLWMRVNGDLTDFDTTETTFFGEGLVDDAWFEAVRALMLVGMAFYFIGIFVSIVENCVSSRSKDYGVSGGMMLFAGLCGAVAVVVFAAKVEDTDLNSLDFQWAFMITAAASGLVIFISIVLLIVRNSNRPTEEKLHRTADYVYAHNNHNMPYLPEYNNQGYRADDLPLVSRSSFRQAYPQTSQHPYRPSDNYNPYGFSRGGMRNTYAEGADLSNGFTQGMVHNDNHMYGRTQSPYLYNGSGPY